jgi:hypothetical protein
MHLQLDPAYLRRQRVRCAPQRVSLEHFEKPGHPVCGGEFIMEVESGGTFLAEP